MSTKNIVAQEDAIVSEIDIAAPPERVTRSSPMPENSNNGSPARSVP